MVTALDCRYLFPIPPPTCQFSSRARVGVVDSLLCCSAASSSLFDHDHPTMVRMTVLLTRRRRRAALAAGGGSVGVAMMNLISEPEYFRVGRLIGSYGFLNITRQGSNFFFSLHRISLVWIIDGMIDVVNFMCSNAATPLGVFNHHTNHPSITPRTTRIKETQQYSAH